MGRLVLRMVLLVQHMGRIGITIGAGVQTLGVDGAMGRARGGHQMGLEEVSDLGLALGQDRVPAMDMGPEVVVLMVAGMGPEVGPATLLPVGLVEEAVAPVVVATGVTLRRMLGTGATMAN